ncbi:MAG: type II secretion system protein [Patescibacteria group bacterium]
MESLKIYINKNSVTLGFSLLEVLLVLAMLSFIAGSTLLFSVQYYQDEIIRVEETTLISLLQTARAQSMHNIDGQSHGVAVNPNNNNEYILFAGDSLATAEESTRLPVSHSDNIAIATSSLSEVVFSQLSGTVVENGEITLVDRNRPEVTSTLTINYEGAIY